jgi:hypothetical protein
LHALPPSIPILFFADEVLGIHPYADRFRGLPAFASWSWLSCEVRTNRGGFCFGRSTDSGGHVEGIHVQVGSPASLLIDEAKTVDEDVLDTFSRCTTAFRLFMSSTGNASGGFYRIMTSDSHLWKTFRVTSSMCPHVDPALIAADRENLKDSVFRIKHGAEWLYDAGDSCISLEHVRALIENRLPSYTGASVGGRKIQCTVLGSS